MWQLIRTLSSLVCIAMAIAAMILTPLFVLQQTWAIAGTVLVEWGIVDDAQRWFMAEDKLIAALTPPNPLILLKWAITGFGVFAALVLIAEWFTSMRARVARIAQLPVVAASQSTWQTFLNEHPGRGRRAVSLYIIETDVITAFAVSCAPERHSIALSRGLLNCPEEVIGWVLSHELAHIVHGDTGPASLWLLFVRHVELIRKSIELAHRLLYRLPGRRPTPVGALLVLPPALCLKAIHFLLRLGVGCALPCYLILDRWTSRNLEFEADSFASRVMGAAPGIWLLSRLPPGRWFEPTFGLLATHPSHQKRIERLERHSERQEA